ncbi:MAG TPA: guanine deaminase [Chthoniobacterales bacterium]|nr:guanine deaminase [Chthoniobacterales bacterium]
MKIFLLLLSLLLSSLVDAHELYVRGQMLHFLNNPDLSAESYQYFKDGLLVVHDKKIKEVGDFSELEKTIPVGTKVTHYKEGLILPGFIDTHTHYPQLDMIAANSGGHLLQWLEKFTFPFEKKFKDQRYANEVANFFLDELIRNGTTTAMVFTTVYPEAVDALFKAAEARGMCIIAGEVIGDRNLPEHLIQSPEKASKETEQLIKKWHQKPQSRLLYAITFRFAPTTSPEAFQKIEELKKKYSEVCIHTHISENQQETKWSNQLFGTKNYLDIYDCYHLLSNKTLLAHGVYLTDEEEQRMKTTGTSIAFCPTSNLFLGSGLFDLKKAEKNGVTVGLGTDVGAGTSFSMLQTLNDAYKVLQLQNQNLSPLEGFYLATLGGAKALALDQKLGNFLPGKEADFIVLNMAGVTPLLKRRLSYATALEDKLFVLMTIGDDRSIMATYIDGKLAWSQK